MQEQEVMTVDEVSSIDLLVQGMDVSIVDDFSKETTTIQFPKLNLCYAQAIPKEDALKYVSAQYKEHKRAQKLLNNSLMQADRELGHYFEQERVREQAASLLSKQGLSVARGAVRARRGFFSFFSNQSFEDRYNNIFELAQQERYGCEKLHNAITHGVGCVSLLARRFAQEDKIRNTLVGWGIAQQDLAFITSRLCLVAGKKLDLLERERDFYCPQESNFLA